MSNQREQETNVPPKEEAPTALVAPPTPVITWERSARRPKQANSANTHVIPFDAKRRQGVPESEATFTVREIPSLHGEEPVRLIVISSGFGQQLPAHRNTVQGMAAA
ncbi:hypothetical protein ACFPES_32280 [Paenibacillus sp. GCM10023248]|uniref:hypothetical protein n=1 Tax=unclassified Paenibacillus TaxID=185978 RepID=UPI0023794798|nr:hypothetical protein [Paenibacillus sp. MAHUQ-63]MDD9271721.1 hypothetical protein [Paenibacillus sp. MAHUQ-63]